MTATYSGNPATSARDEVRFLARDTDVSQPWLQDEEIDYLLGRYPDPYLAAAVAAEQIAASLGQEATVTRVGDLEVDRTLRKEAYLELASSLRQRAIRRSVRPYAGGLSRADKIGRQQDADAVQPAFTRDLQDFPGTTPEDFPR